MFQEDDRVVAPECLFHEPLGVIRRGRDHDAKPGEMSVHGIIIAGVMGGGGMADADAAAEQKRHTEPAVAHVADLGDLIDDLADGVEDEVGEHEIDDRAGAGHGGAAAEADEPPFADRRVAQARRAVDVIEAGRRLEVAAALADAFAHHEDRRITCHFLGERLEGRLHVADLPRGIGRGDGAVCRRQGGSSCLGLAGADSSKTKRTAVSGSGQGLDSANSLASTTTESISASMSSSSSAGTAWASTSEARRQAIGQRVFQPSTSSRVR